MRLDELAQVIRPTATGGDLAREIEGLCYDSRQVKPGGLFFALRGGATDGHDFIPAARERGAAAFVLEEPSRAPEGMTWLRVDDARLAMSRAAAAFYGNPTGGVPVIGITGTNGKTTTTYLVEAILAQAGISSAVLGTISYRFGARVIPAPHTTPESVDLQRTIRELVDLGAAGVVMEVSSHALEQHRVDGCRFDVGIFTNLTRDHLDYHHDMESYFGSKARLFTELLAADAGKPRRAAVINIDDPYGLRLAAVAAAPVISYGLSAGAAVRAEEVSFTVDGVAGSLVTPAGTHPFRSRLLGRFNLYNILAAAAAGVALDIPLAAIAAAIGGNISVPGRLERVENDRGVTVLVDYAHTGDALENVLETVAEIATGRIITVFGCGGDRDRGKRPVMGEIAGRFSDLTIVTSDNPRTEEPAAIIAEVLAGIRGTGLREFRPEDAGGTAEKGFTALESRRAAIRLAVQTARPGDIVLLAGKGHEDYQIIGTVKHHFDDREEAAAALRDRD
ncbi:UDP-N-acetylmuramoyl-L-alanyl-D-glutamate--2,6-diaminopimelate ligase [Geobacter pickeringii]|uniref:UDP-N-acetylmuramoyl-L-alanyl-D-glutamate--2,6-diaminopimelate ligase n=1 Tax=Geobacter pickeringii TaxID=345632 RepID=A0A0B5B778_9BACT|nr:UDP-N-acetylmuramoyl-L-alanyl-D-glutamate--2,6-diaminopimelate ligase [Geobacter pickeringii]AJE02368.1 UDP-N-acetylmuramoylalanyl-D-glutamate--2,6-diaminopimelate ligase [Geobacter pickeringii]